MAVPWLLIAVLGLRGSEVSCQFDETVFGSPPPLPRAGMFLCIYKEKYLLHSISSTNGPERRTETRQRLKSKRRLPCICN